jgi:hypothetical protein
LSSLECIFITISKNHHHLRWSFSRFQHHHHQWSFSPFIIIIIVIILESISLWRIINQVSNFYL